MSTRGSERHFSVTARKGAKVPSRDEETVEMPSDDGA
jgi:hypothetical protein